MKQFCILMALYAISSVQLLFAQESDTEAFHVPPTPKECWLLPFYEQPTFRGDYNPFAVAIDTCGFNYNEIFPLDSTIKGEPPFQYYDRPALCETIGGLSKLQDTTLSTLSQRIYAFVFHFHTLSLDEKYLDTAIVLPPNFQGTDTRTDTIDISAFFAQAFSESLNLVIQFADVAKLDSLIKEGEVKVYVGVRKNNQGITYREPIFVFNKYQNIDSLHFSLASHHPDVPERLMIPIIDCKAMVTSINSQKASISSTKIFPNPSTGLFSIELKASVKGTDILCLDSEGRQLQPVIRKKSETLYIIDFSKFSAGIYHVSIGSQTFHCVVKR